jgi:hypothetical protein
MHKYNIPNKFPIGNQGNLASCTAFAIVYALQFLLHEDFSVEFLYYIGRFSEDTPLNFYMKQLTNHDVEEEIKDKLIDKLKIIAYQNFNFGIYAKSTLDLISTVVICTNKKRPYSTNIKIANEYPSSSQFNDLIKFNLYYHQLDENNQREDLLIKIKKSIKDNLPVICSVWMFNNKCGDISLPNLERETSNLSHCICLCGYDDNYEIKHNKEENVCKEEKGAFVFKNSWGTEWGKDGYGYLPYNHLQLKCKIDKSNHLYNFLDVNDNLIHDIFVIYKVTKIDSSSKDNKFDSYYDVLLNLIKKYNLACQALW